MLMVVSGNYKVSDQEATIMTMTTMIMMITAMMPIITFLFFHHILFLTFREVSRKSRDWSAKVSLFLTKISILSPRSMTLSIFLRACSSSSLSYFFNPVSLSASALLLYFDIHSWRMGLKSLREWATAPNLWLDSYRPKKASCIFLRKFTAILISYYLSLTVRSILPSRGR